MKNVDILKIIDRFDLKIFNDSKVETKINVSDVNRPALEMAGFFEYFAFERIQILGRTEMAFLDRLPETTKCQRLEKLLTYDVPCIIITRGYNPPEELLKAAKEKQKWVLGTHMPTTRFISRLTNFLEGELAPRTNVHGVLVELYGIGILIMGESGIGKSETAVELIKQGHRLIADDVVEIKQVARNILIGSAPELLQHYLEVRGLGIVDVKTFFGAGAVRKAIKIELVTELVEWDKYVEYDRLGLEEETIKILDSTLPKKTIPIRPGRNVAAILEVAAMDHRLKALGYNAAKQFSERLLKELEKNKNKKQNKL